ncbi:MAG: flagellar biosynthesis protein FlgE [Nitrospinae bacterium CG11_big_fil_rev_8_21_14_0_20_56_8]|nr:MAG: flagellar biosynthesis protein FlgE [Nitrospinae bacterium CG11_big_fil_rev_8_21_14_0_20_56_8]
MALISSLFTGVTGLNGNSKAMNIIGDNIANVNTIGFKGSKAVFSDIFSTILTNGSVTSQLGRGSQLQGVIQSFNQGSFESSSNALDLAIDGSGFFVVNNGSGNFYTRAGQFRLNDDGKVQAITGEILQGHQITNGTASSTVTDIDLAGVQSAPQASTAFTLGANLDTSASAGTTFNSPVTLYNSIGDQLLLNYQWTKSATANQWNFTLSSSKGTVSTVNGAAFTSGSVTFNTSGALSSVALNGTALGSLADIPIVVSFAGVSPTAADLSVNWDIATSGASNGKITGFSADSNNNSMVQDGFTTGTLVGLSVTGDGTIFGLFNNGQTEDLYQIAMADFLAPSGLTRKGSNLFAESAQSGQPILGTAETGGFGSIIGNTLELSNVDLAAEFVTMIQTQQAFQASARVISTTDNLLTETVNLVR